MLCVSGRNQLNTETVKFSPVSMDKDNFGKVCVELKRSNTTLLSFSVLFHPRNFSGTIFCLKWARLRYIIGSCTGISARTSSRLGVVGEGEILLTGKFKVGIAPTTSLFR